MESRIKVGYDHEQKEPYISVSMTNLKPDDNDLRDEMLQNLIEGSETLPMLLVHTDGSTWGSHYQFRIINSGSVIQYQQKLVGLFQNYAQNVLGIPDEDQKRIFNSFFCMLHGIVGSSGLGSLYELDEKPKIGEANTQLKTVRDYFELQLLPEYRLAAFNNAIRKKLDWPAKNLHDAFCVAMDNDLGGCKEGIDFWYEAINRSGYNC